jgi:tetratricopeptide (TPR) repeat protein
VPAERKVRAIGAAAATAIGLAAVVTLTWLTIERNKQYRDKLTIWQDTVGKAPHNPRARHNLGAALMEHDRVDEAMAQFSKAIEVDPTYADAYAQLSACESVKQQYDDAIKHAAEAVRLNPRHARGHVTMASALAAKGRNAEALEHWRSAVATEPSMAAAHAGLGDACNNLERLDEAAQAYQAALAADANAVSPMASLGLTWLKKGEPAKAAEQFHAALGKPPAGSQDRLAKVEALIGLGRTVDAFAQWRAVFNKASEVELHSAFAAYLIKYGRGATAKEHLLEALRVDGNSVAAANNMAWLLATDPDPAVADGNEALRLASAVAAAVPSNAGILETLSAAQAAAGQFEQASDTSRRAIDLAEAAGNLDLAGEIRQRLPLFQARQPYRRAPLPLIAEATGK